MYQPGWASLMAWEGSVLPWSLALSLDDSVRSSLLELLDLQDLCVFTVSEESTLWERGRLSVACSCDILNLQAQMLRLEECERSLKVNETVVKF